MKKKNFLFNKTVVITGASGGIGFNVAKLLIEKYNCKIIGIARNEEKLLKNIETLGEKKENFSYRLFDVSVKENWNDFYDYLVENNVQIDVLINNAGFMLPFEKFENYSEDEIESIISTNFLSVIYATKKLLPLLKKSTHPTICNIASSAGMCAVVGESMYCATKFAVRGFTETLQQDYKKEIYVAGVYPGFIRTNILHKMSVSDKNNKLINKLMMPVEKASKKIVNGLAKKKKRMVMGIDGCSLTFFGRIFPTLTPSIVSGVLKASKLELFDNVFNKN